MTKQKQDYKHLIPSWIRWTAVLFVLAAILGGTVLWIIQGSQAIIPVAVLTALGTLIGFLQVFPILFPEKYIKPEELSTSSPPQQPSSKQLPGHSSLIQPYLMCVQEYDLVDGKFTQNQENTTKKVDWGNAPYIKQLYGREKELIEMKQWIENNNCRVLAILGVGGIGKTSLAVMLANQVKNGFISINWYSLQNAPPLQHILRSCIQHTSDQQQGDLPENQDDQLSLLLSNLRQGRHLIVLDNVESILQGGQHVGQYREEYKGYGKLFQCLGEALHQSCIILTSREKPKEVALLEGKNALVRSYELKGLNVTNGQLILQEKGLNGVAEVQEALVTHYAGNPLVLKLVSQFIQEVFHGDIADFLKNGERIFSDINDILGQQFERLSTLEQEVLYWLAIERESMLLSKLQKNFVLPVSKREIYDALRSLQRRSLLEMSSSGLILQNVIIEYITENFINNIIKEIDTKEPALLVTHALMQAQAKDFVRESQIYLIIKPIAQKMLLILGRDEFIKRCNEIIATQRERYPWRAKYLVGNILNLLIQSGYDIRGYDFSYMEVRQAYLANVSLPDVNFSYADLTTSVFTDIFGRVLSITFSPNGQSIAAGTTANRGDIHVWVTNEWTPLLTLQGHADWVRSVAFSPDGEILASGSDDQTIRLWDINSGQCIKILQGHTSWVRTVTFSYNGKFLASSSDDHSIHLWKLDNDYELRVLLGHSGTISSIAFSPDGTKLASGGMDQTLRLWDISTGQCLEILRGHTDAIWSVAFSPDGNCIATSSQDQTIRLWEGSTGHTIRVLYGHTSTVQSVAFSPDQQFLASGGDDRTVRLWDPNTGLCLKILHSHTERVSSVAFSPDQQFLASGGDDRTVRLWDPNTGLCLKTLYGYADGIRSAAFNFNGELLASGGDDQHIHLWNTSTGQCFKTLMGHTDVVRMIAFAPDGKLIASASEDQTVRLWDVSTGQCIKVLRRHTNWVRSVTFSLNGRLLASGGDDSLIILWEVKTGQCLKILQGHNKRIWSIAFNFDSHVLASSSDDRTVRLWDTSTGQCLKILQGHDSWVYSVAFTPDGTLLASSSEDQTVRLWNTNTGQCLKILQGHTSRVWSVTFTPDGTLLISGSEDQTVRLWNTNTGQCLKILQGHTSRVRFVTTDPSGIFIISGGPDGTMMLWDMQTGQHLRTMRNDRPYEGMNIMNVKGLTETQKDTLLALGAIERPQSEQA